MTRDDALTVLAIAGVVLVAASLLIAGCKLGPNAVDVPPDYPPSTPFAAAKDASPDR